mmetsp:Transcript_41741/g.88422  ORF Transcript_41741/g.88422 Transcript_41741/m.88422 type:complete len:218 (+) Transcript_41741:60-713(+)
MSLPSFLSFDTLTVAYLGAPEDDGRAAIAQTRKHRLREPVTYHESCATSDSGLETLPGIHRTIAATKQALVRDARQQAALQRRDASRHMGGATCAHKSEGSSTSSNTSRSEARRELAFLAQELRKEAALERKIQQDRALQYARERALERSRSRHCRAEAARKLLLQTRGMEVCKPTTREMVSKLLPSAESGHHGLFHKLDKSAYEGISEVPDFDVEF